MQTGARVGPAGRRRVFRSFFFAGIGDGPCWLCRGVGLTAGFHSLAARSRLLCLSAEPSWPRPLPLAWCLGASSPPREQRDDAASFVSALASCSGILHPHGVVPSPWMLPSPCSSSFPGAPAASGVAEG